MEELISYLRELRVDNAATGERLRAEQARDEKEKADIVAAERTLTSWWEKHKPGEPLPDDVAGEKAKPIHIHMVNPDPVEGLKQVLLAAFEFLPERFTTKEFFPMVGAIQSGEVPESQGYDFLRRQVDEGKLWVFQQGAGRRPTIFSKKPVSEIMRILNNATNRLTEPNLVQTTEVPS